MKRTRTLFMELCVVAVVVLLGFAMSLRFDQGSATLRGLSAAISDYQVTVAAGNAVVHYAEKVRFNTDENTTAIDLEEAMVEALIALIEEPSGTTASALFLTLGAPAQTITQEKTVGAVDWNFANGTTYKVEDDADAFFKDGDFAGNLVVDGTATVSGANSYFGTNDGASQHTMQIYGKEAGAVNGAQIYMAPAADYDGAFSNFIFSVNADDLRFQRSAAVDGKWMSDGTFRWMEPIVNMGEEATDAIFDLSADLGTDNSDFWRLHAVDGGNFKVASYSTGAWVDRLELTNTGDLQIDAELDVDGVGTSTVAGTLEVGSTITNTAGNLQSQAGVLDTNGAGVNDMEGSLDVALGATINSGQGDNDTAIYGNSATPAIAVQASDNRAGFNIAVPLAGVHIEASQPSLLLSDADVTPRFIRLNANTDVMSVIWDDGDNFSLGTSDVETDEGIDNVFFTISASGAVSIDSMVGVGVTPTVASYEAESAGPLMRIGDSSTVSSGNGGIALGRHSESVGVDAVALGYGSEANGDYSYALGYESEANATTAMALGREIIVSGAGSMGIALNDQNGAELAQANTLAVMGGKVGFGVLAPAAGFEFLGDDVKFSDNGSLFISLIGDADNNSVGDSVIRYYEAADGKFATGYNASNDNWEIDESTTLDDSPYFAVNQSDGSVGILTATPDTTLQVVGTVKIGDDNTNFATLSATGLALTGDARYKDTIDMGAATFEVGSSAPSSAAVGNYAVWEYGVGDDSVITFEVPHSWAVGTDITVSLDWSCAEGDANDDVQWNVTWTATPHDNTEALDVAGTTLDPGDIPCPATAHFLVRQAMGTIAGASLAAEDEIGMTIERVAVAGVEPANEPYITHVYVEFTADKHGEAM